MTFDVAREAAITPEGGETRWVYLVGSVASRAVKIGVATNPRSRLNELKTGSPVPLHLIWKTRGNVDLEANLHEYFSPYRLHGEWFDFGNEDPAALVATAALLMGYGTYPARVAEDARLPLVAPVPADETSVITHLINAASVTGRDAVTNAEAFAYLATAIPAFVQADSETVEQYRSRAGKSLIQALRSSGFNVRPVKVPTARGTRSMGYRLTDMQRAVSERHQRRSVRR